MALDDWLHLFFTSAMMQETSLRDMVTELVGHDDASIDTILPLFREQRWPRGRTFAIPESGWHYLSVIAEGFVHVYFEHGFERHTLGVFGVGDALPPFGFYGGQASRIFLESHDFVRFHILDVADAESANLSCLPKLLLASYDCVLGKVIQWATLLHLPSAELRYMEMERQTHHLIGHVPDRLLASMLGITWRHYMRIKNKIVNRKGKQGG